MRDDVPIVRQFGGLAVTPTLGPLLGFTITHARTGCAVPGLTALPYETSFAVASILAEAFAWHAVDDVFFFRSMPPDHQEALRGCIGAVREMFGVE
jgi:hypothetical protein